MKPRVAALAVCAACAACAAPAHAQAPGAAIGGSVPSTLALGLDVPSPLAAFPSGRGVWAQTITATVTATDGGATLSVADGDATSAPRLGHLAAGARTLADPLELTVGGDAFQPLDLPLGPLLMQWSDALGAQRTPIRLRQRVRTASALAYTKTLLITASSETP